MKSCLVADDHPGVVAALTAALDGAGFEVIGKARNGHEAVELAATTTPTCAVVDFRMPGVEGEDLLAALHAASPETAIVVYTAEVSVQLARDAVAAGATAVVLKESPLSEVVDALQAALVGRAYLDPALVSVASADAPNPLSPRETEVLALVADGLSYEEIGCRLGIGDETARTYLKKACSRLEATTRTHAVAKALRLGWIH